MSDSDDPSAIPDWELELGLPQFKDPFIQQYFSGRAALIEQEKSTRSDDSFRSSLTPIANEACAIVERIRDEELRTVWSSADQGNGGEGSDVFPGMMFSLARDKMEQTKLWKIVSKIPKGALLHAHFDAMIDAEWLIETALQTEGMALVLTGDFSTPQERESGKAMFRYINDLSSLSSEEKPTIWNTTHPIEKVVSAAEAADAFPNGGRPAFIKWLAIKCTITASESLDHHLGLDAIWRRFGSCFNVLNSSLSYEPILRAAIPRLLSQLLADGIQWVDFRLATWHPFYRTGHTTPETTHTALFRVFDECITDFQTTTSTTETPFWGARIIWTSLRASPPRTIVENMTACLSTKKSFPHLIAGYDLVGQEDRGRPLTDLIPELFWFRKRCAEENLTIPFFFHAGECLGDGDATDENLFDAILLGTRRIGHAFSLFKHPLLIEMVKRKAICVESCPISNEVLRLTSSIQAHPLPALLARGVHTALCNDDPAILGHGKNGLTHDFWQALQGWENLGLAGLGALAENSVRYAAFGPGVGGGDGDEDGDEAKAWVKGVRDGVHGVGVRGERMREWRRRWESFCEWVLVEYAADYGSDGEGEGEGDG